MGLVWFNASMQATDWLSALLSDDLSDDQAMAALSALIPDNLSPADLFALWQMLWSLRPALPTDTPDDLMDCCGTGGSGLSHFNTSTCVAFVLAAAGVPVVKFGNRAATSASGSFDFLEALGLPASPWPVSELPDRLAAGGGLVFLSAAQVYPQLGRLARWRKAFGRPTVFNGLGPLLNPVRPAYRLMGVSLPGLVEKLGAIATAHDNHRVTLIVSAPRRDGPALDEVALDTDTTGHLWQATGPFEGEPWHYKASQPGSVHWADTSAVANLARFRAMLSGEDRASAAFRLVCLNAGVALWVRGWVDSVEAGVQRAQALFAEGAVADQVARVVRVAQR